MKGLMNLLFEEEGGIKTKTAQPQAPPQTTQPVTGINPLDRASHSPSPSFGVASTVGAAHIDEKHVQYFEKVMNDANLPGPDLFELKASVNSMRSFIPDEPNLYRAAFASLQPTGLTKDVAVTSGEKYIQLIDEKFNAFMKSARDKEAAEVGDARSQIDILSKRNAEIEKERETNLQLIAQHNEKINRATETVRAKTGSFEATYNAVKRELQSHIDKIKTYIS